jgi:hypothetical protein
MSAMQTDMDSTTTDCYIATTATNDAIATAFDLTNYANSAFNPPDFTSYGQVIAIQMMDEFTRCGFNNYLIALDQGVSKYPQLIGTGSNLITQLITGSEDEDTTVYLTLHKLNDNFTNRQYELFAQNSQLFMSSLLKFESPQVYADVSFVSN